MNQAVNIANATMMKLMTNNAMSIMQMLGFDVALNENKFKTSFNSTMFTKPNVTAVEILVHFLLSTLDPDRAQKTFSQCWPHVLKEQQKEFKEAILAWLLELSPSSSSTTTKLQQQVNKTVVNPAHQALLQHIKIPTVTKSLLLTPTGLKVCELLFDLSQYVLLARLLKLSRLYFRLKLAQLVR